MEVKLNQEEEAIKAPSFDPRKNYQWKEDSTFNLSATEFGTMHRLLTKFLHGNITPASILGVADIFAILQHKLKQAVEAGEATELKEEAKETE